MTISYNEFKENTLSEKVILCHLEPKQRLILFNLESGSVYSRSVDYFVVNVAETTTNLTEANSSSLSTGEWYYDPLKGKLYVNTSDDTNPNTKEIVVTYRLFYASRGVNIPHDLDTGTVVHYDGRLIGNTPISKDLDDEQIGIVLESSTNISLENTDGHFDEFYDVLFFENKVVNIWLWNESMALSSVKKIFTGEVEDKSYTDSKVKFRCKDFIYKLRQFVNLERFSNSDGNVAERYLNTPKRRLYGQFDQARTVPIDSILDGFTLTGTISGSTTSATLTGTGTSFLDEVSPGDKLIYETDQENFEFSVESVDGDTQITLSDELTIVLDAVTLKDNPERPWRKKNRNWHIAGHKLRAPSTTVLSASQPNRFIVNNISDFFASDLIEVNGEAAFIRRVSGSQVLVEQNLQGGTPSPGDTVTKVPLSRAFVNGSEVFINRDWTITNGSSDAILNLDNLAEFNVAPKEVFPVNLTFTNGSRTVTGSGIDFKVELKTRDWIRSTDSSHTTWYEILRVEENTITLRVAYAGSNYSSGAEKKNIDLIDDMSVVTVNTLGLEDNSTWIKTASDAVKHLIENDASLTNIDSSGFTEADADGPYILSYAIPSKIGEKTPKVRDAISDINSSVFGSLTYNDNFDVTYSVLHAERPSTLSEIKDDDLIGGISYRSKNDIVRKVNARYRFRSDKFTGDEAFSLYQFTNDFVDTYINATEEEDIDIYLYSDNDAETIAQRYAFYHSLSQSTVNIKGKLNLSSYQLNDKIWLALDRIYKRFANKARKKICIVNKVRFDGTDTSLELTDLGNSFNRVGVVSANNTSDFTSATENEKLLNAFCVDSDLEVPDTSSDLEIFGNLIG